MDENRNCVNGITFGSSGQRFHGSCFIYLSGIQGWSGNLLWAQLYREIVQFNLNLLKWRLGMCFTARAGTYFRFELNQSNRTRKNFNTPLTCLMPRAYWNFFAFFAKTHYCTPEFCQYAHKTPDIIFPYCVLADSQKIPSWERHNLSAFHVLKNKCTRQMRTCENTQLARHNHLSNN